MKLVRQIRDGGSLPFPSRRLVARMRSSGYSGLFVWALLALLAPTPAVSRTGRDAARYLHNDPDHHLGCNATVESVEHWLAHNDESCLGFTPSLRLACSMFLFPILPPSPARPRPPAALPLP